MFIEFDGKNQVSPGGATYPTRLCRPSGAEESLLQPPSTNIPPLTGLKIFCALSYYKHSAPDGAQADPGHYRLDHRVSFTRSSVRYRADSSRRPDEL